MAVYVDNANIRASVSDALRTVHGVWCHMTADTRPELDEMADAIGMQRSWIQYPGTWQEHYDVTRARRQAAVAAGAIEVDLAEHIHWLTQGPPGQRGPHPAQARIAPPQGSLFDTE